MEIHGHLVVIPYDVIPHTPTFPTVADIIVTYLVGSATISQITDADDHKLFGPDGNINTDPITRLGSSAARWAALNGISQSKLSDAYMLGNNKYHKWTVKGIDDATYSNYVMSKDFVVEINDLPISPNSTDEISVDPNEASFGLHTSDSSKPLSVSLVTGGDTGDSSMRTAVLKTATDSSGYDSLAFDASRVRLSYTHEGEPTTFDITLGWAANNGLPTVFKSGPIPIGPGQTASFHPTNWQALNQAPVELTVTSQKGIVSHQLLHSLQETMPFTIDNLSVLDTDSEEKILKIDTTWADSDNMNGTMVFVWLVTKDNSLIARNLITLKGKNQNIGGSRSDSWTFSPPESGQYNFTAYVLGVTGQMPSNSHVLHNTIPFTIGNIRQQRSTVE